MNNYDDIINNHEDRIEALEEGGGGSTSASDVSYDDTTTQYGESTVQKVLEKIKSLFANYLPLSGGSFTGDITADNGVYYRVRDANGTARTLAYMNANNNYIIGIGAIENEIYIGTDNYTNAMHLRGKEVEVTGNLTASNIGTRKDAPSMSANITLTTASTAYEIQKVSLTKGNWILIARVRYNSPSADGLIRVALSTTSASTSLNNSVQRPIVKGSGGIVEVSLIVSPTSTTTYYLNALSNVAGLVINSATTDFRALQIS